MRALASSAAPAPARCPDRIEGEDFARDVVEWAIKWPPSLRSARTLHVRTVHVVFTMSVGSMGRCLIASEADCGGAGGVPHRCNLRSADSKRSNVRDYENFRKKC